MALCDRWARSRWRLTNRTPQNWHVKLAVGLGVLLVMGIGLYVVVRTSGPRTTTRPTETARVERARSDEATREGGKQVIGPINVPPPQGTIRRMEAISKAFK
jgi:hypothetical protein